jgi:hypothetical protein
MSTSLVKRGSSAGPLVEVDREGKPVKKPQNKYDESAHKAALESAKKKQKEALDGG